MNVEFWWSSFCGVLVEFVLWGSGSRLRALGHGFRTKPRSTLVFVLRLALDAPWLGVVGILHEPTGVGLGVSVGFWCRLAAVVHAPTLFVFRFGISGGVFEAFY
ncbi:hypothetical protein AUO94_03960 [Planococcus kocurii]|uniref:Secreted protein n=1 Tax=Planococcus kocurii TaxID=1374 RepID=A0ABN4JSC8_9BACL|nr:hypothetical protein AUO94_03960 [Planococcus kocurii]